MPYVPVVIEKAKKKKKKKNNQALHSKVWIKLRTIIKDYVFTRRYRYKLFKYRIGVDNIETVVTNNALMSSQANELFMSEKSSEFIHATI